MAAVLTFESVNTDKVVEYIEESRRVLLPGGGRGIDVWPPDISTSEVGFTPVFADDEPRAADTGHIRFGLSAVKGVGEKAVAAIIAERDEGGSFDSLHEFCERVALGQVNRSTIEALIKCGAFDALHDVTERAALVEALPAAIRRGQRKAEDRASGQTNLFVAAAEEAGEVEAAPRIRLPEVAPWPLKDQLKNEKKVLGFYVSSHPLEQYLEILETFGNTCVGDLTELPDGAEVTVGGMFTQIRKRVTQRGRSAGQTMAICGFEDPTGSVEVVAFSEVFARFGHLLEEDRVAFLQGKLQQRDASPSVLVSRVIPIEDCERLTEGARIVLRAEDLPDAKNGSNGELRRRLTELRDLLWESRGGGGPSVEVAIEVHTEDQVVTVGLNGTTVKVDRGMRDRVATILGVDDCFELLGPRKLAPEVALSERLSAHLR